MRGVSKWPGMRKIKDTRFRGLGRHELLGPLWSRKRGCGRERAHTHSPALYESWWHHLWLRDIILFFFAFSVCSVLTLASTTPLSLLILLHFSPFTPIPCPSLLCHSHHPPRHTQRNNLHTPVFVFNTCTLSLSLSLTGPFVPTKPPLTRLVSAFNLHQQTQPQGRNNNYWNIIERPLLKRSTFLE